MTLKIPIVFLGTGQAVPTEKRNHSAILLSYKNENILVDCGEGTQRQFRKAHINPCRLTRLLITHWHGDHVLGIPGLLQTLALNNYSKTLHIYGPRGTKRFMEELYKIFVPVGKIKIEVREINSGKFFENSDFSLLSYSLEHDSPCNAYVLQEKDRMRIDKNKLKKLHLSEKNPEIAKLVHGKNIKIGNKTINYKSLTYSQKGRRISFILDTRICEGAKKAAKNADLVVCESTYSNENKDLAKKYKHLTSSQAGEIAKSSKAKELILTHISQRYDNNEKMILEEAKKVFKNTKLAEDFMRVVV